MKLTAVHPICLIFLMAFGPIVGVVADEKTQAAERAAVSWLALVDGEQYESSWNEAASLFKNQVSASNWQKAVTAARSPLGGLIHRNLISATYATSLPGAPDGEYVVLLFETKFENKAQAVETVTPMLDEGQWRVAGYYVR